MDRWTAIETLISVIEAGSFSAGARRMDVGQPAVSKSIAQLESRLGVRLFVRTTRGLTPTEAGQRFYERAKNAIDIADDAELQARGAGTSMSGTLRVCERERSMPIPEFDSALLEALRTHTTLMHIPVLDVVGEQTVSSNTTVAG